MHWKTLKVPHKTVKWLDKRYPFGQRVFGFEIKPSFCVGRLKMRASNTTFYGHTIAKFCCCPRMQFLRIKRRFQADVLSFSLAKKNKVFWKLRYFCSPLLGDETLSRKCCQENLWNIKYKRSIDQTVEQNFQTTTNTRYFWESWFHKCQRNFPAWQIPFYSPPPF